MIFSAAAEYGVRVMVELGRHGGERPLSLKAIAEAESLPLSYLEHIVPKLKEADLIRSSANSSAKRSSISSAASPQPR